MLNCTFKKYILIQIKLIKRKQFWTAEYKFPKCWTLSVFRLCLSLLLIEIIFNKLAKFLRKGLMQIKEKTSAAIIINLYRENSVNSEMKWSEPALKLEEKWISIFDLIKISSASVRRMAIILTERTRLNVSSERVVNCFFFSRAFEFRDQLTISFFLLEIVYFF